MKTNPLGPLMVGIFLVVIFVGGALATSWLSLKYYFSVRELTKLNIRAITINQTRNAVQNLAGEALQYSRTHPAIDPILEKFEVKERGTNAPQPNAAPSK